MTTSHHDIADAAWRESTPVPLSWRAGPWALEVRGDELADIRFDGVLVLRSVRAVVRDQDWGTVPTRVTALEVTEHTLHFALRQDGLGASFESALEVTVDGDTVTVAYRASAGADFDRNRIGLVVLHPPTVAGTLLGVTHTDGALTTTAFPTAISPHQPALDIAALQWAENGIDLRLDFAGETFEMEDQRNWTDASFKTYGTPLALPFPVRIDAGETVRQSLTLRGLRVAPSRETDAAPRVDLVPGGFGMPEIVLGASTAPGEPPTPSLPASAPGGFAPLATALLVELDTTTTTWRGALERARHEAAGRPLDVRILAASTQAIGAVLETLEGTSVVRLGVFSSVTHVAESDLLAELERAASQHRIDAELVGGTRGHFAELNREHHRLPATGSVAFSITPQMHAREREQLVESIAMQRRVAEDAVRIAAGRPVHVGPVTLRARFNAVATSGSKPDDRPFAVAGYGAALEPGATDARQESSALAAWTVASAAALAIPGVASLNYFETWGPRGIAGRPVAQAIAWLNELAGLPALVPTRVPPGVWAVGAQTVAGPVVLVANLSAAPVSLLLTAASASERSHEIVVGPLALQRVMPAREFPVTAGYSG